MDPLVAVGVVLSIAVALVTAVAALRRAGPGDSLDTVARGSVKGLQGVALMSVFVQVVRFAQGARPESMTTHVGYAVAAVAIIPILTMSRDVEEESEPAPASHWVGVVAALAVAVVLWRLGATA